MSVLRQFHNDRFINQVTELLLASRNLSEGQVCNSEFETKF